MMRDPLKALLEFEQDVDYQEFESEKEPALRYIAGRNRILISAPHGAVHLRRGNPKEEDEFTAAIARWVASRTSSHVLYLRRRVNFDANRDADCPYKRKLKSVVREKDIGFVLDIHGAALSRDFGIALGTMRGRSCSDARKRTIIQALNAEGFDENATGLKRLDKDKAFPGVGRKGAITIIRYVSEQLSISAAQFEINASLRIPLRREDASQKCFFKGDARGISRTLRALENMVNAISKDEQEFLSFASGRFQDNASLK